MNGQTDKATRLVRRVDRLLRWLGGTVALTVLLVGGYAVLRLNNDEPVTYSDDAEHFKYGSTGGERGWKQQFGFGIPYWIWISLPEMFPQYLPDGQPGNGYASFGMVYEDHRDARFELPVGMSMRKVMGVDRVYFNCALCHTGTIRETAQAKPQIVLGMPANRFELGTLIGFLDNATKDKDFRASTMLPAIQSLAEQRDAAVPADGRYVPDPLGLVDRQLFRFFAIATMREQLLTVLGRLAFIDTTTWGPGRVDTFNAPKPLLGFRMDTASELELTGNTDFPSVWHQKARKGMWLHWDGNNCSVDERNLSAGFGTGATPATIDRDKVLRVADWLWDTARPPPFPAEHVNKARAEEGKALFSQYCWRCHGKRDAPFRNPGDGSLVGTVTPIEEIGTDRWRLDSYTPELASAQNTLYAGFPLAGDEACQEYIESVCDAGQDEARYRELRAQCYPSRFSHFRKTFGYASMPLDGLWLRAPYLHNGSVPSLRELLLPEQQRSKTFYIGYDVYDFDNAGFVTSGPEAAAKGWLFDTTARGNGNQGHSGYAYGTELAQAQKDALLEYLKTF